MRFIGFAVAVVALAASRAANGGAQQTQGTARYRAAHTYALGGDGGWDYVILDSAGRRLFIGRQDRIMVVDASAGTLIGEVPGLKGAHGVALDYHTGRGFATSGRDSSVVMFDLKTLKVLGRIHVAEDADAIILDPASKRVYTFNGDAGSMTMIDPADGRALAEVKLGGKPEYGVSAGDGKLYANIEDKGEVVEIDTRQLKVTRRWSLAPCASPTGLAIDRAHRVLFSACRSRHMAISDIEPGKLITTLPIGAAVDAAAFDPGTQDAFASNGDGTLTVVHEDAPDRFHVVETATTMPGARTMALDPASHRVYLVTAKFGPAPAESTAANPRRRPPVIPGSFTLLVMER